MKSISTVLLILTLAQAACSLPQAAIQATPSLPTVTGNDALIPDPTTSPANADTPPAATSTPESIQVPAATLTETLTPVKLFSDVVLSNQVLSPICEPKIVHFEVTPVDSKVYSVVLFIRLRYKTTGDRTNWNEGLIMKQTGGKFIYDLKASSISDFNQFKDPVAWVQFQLVALDGSGAILGRSEVFTERLTITAVCS